MNRRIFTLLIAILPMAALFGQNPALVTGYSDVISFSSYTPDALLLQSGPDHLYMTGSVYAGSNVLHDQISDQMVSDFPNLYFIKYDKEGAYVGSAIIQGTYWAPQAFSFEEELIVVGASGNEILANGNTIPMDGAERIEFIAKYNDLCQFERIVSVWELGQSQYPSSRAMMDPQTGYLYLYGTNSQSLNLRDHGIIGDKYNDQYLYVLRYDRNLVLDGVFTAGMDESGGTEWGSYNNLELVPNGEGGATVTGTWEGDRSPVIDGDTLGTTDSEGVFAFRLDKELGKVWVMEGSLGTSGYYGTNGITEGMALSDGDMVLVGATSTGFFSLGDLKLSFENGEGASNMFAFRISPDGDIRWARTLLNRAPSGEGKKGTESEEFTSSFDWDAIQWKERVLYLTGEFTGDAFTVAGRPLENPLGSGVFVAALDMEKGEEQWGYALSSSYTQLHGFDLDGSGNVTLMGRTGSIQEYEKMGSFAMDGTDLVFHLGINYDGEPLWFNNAYLDPLSYSFYGTDLEVLEDGEVFSCFNKTVGNPMLIGGASIVSKDPYSAIMVKLNADTHLGGTVYDKSGVIVHPGIVKAFKATTRGAYPLVQIVDIDESGKYMFDGLYPGSYRLLAIPDQDVYPDGMPTYAGGAVSWDDSQRLNLSSNESTSLLDITLSELPKLTELDGSGRVSGNVSYADDFVYKSTMARPAKKTAVLLKKKEAVKGTNEEDIVAYLDTDDDGNYVFDFVPDGGYDMVVDVPGLPMTSNYDVEILGNTIVSECNFLIETEEITTPGATGIIFVKADQLEIYPNPGNGILHLELEDHGDYQVRVFNALGMMMEYRSFPSAGGIIDLDISGLDAGIYFIKLEGEGKSAAVKYVKK